MLEKHAHVLASVICVLQLQTAIRDHVLKINAPVKGKPQAFRRHGKGRYISYAPVNCCLKCQGTVKHPLPHLNVPGGCVYGDSAVGKDIKDLLGLKAPAIIPAKDR